MIKTIVLLGLMLGVLCMTCNDPNCKLCTKDLSVCDECKFGFYLNGTCRSCSIIDKCSRCNFNSAQQSVDCTACSGANAINSTNNTCVSCSPLPHCGKCKLNPDNNTELVC